MPTERPAQHVEALPLVNLHHPNQDLPGSWDKLKTFMDSLRKILSDKL